MAEQLVSSLAAPFAPERYPDEHRDRILALVERKVAGETIEAPAEEPGSAGATSRVRSLRQRLPARSPLGRANAR